MHQSWSLVTNGWSPCLISEYYILYFHFLFQVSHFHFLLFYFTAPEVVLGNKWLKPMLNIRVYCSSLPFMSLYNGFSRRLKQFIVIHFKFPMTDKIPIIGGKQVKFQLFDFMAERWTLGCFSKDTLKKIKCTPHHITGGYLGRSYPEGEADQTSLGGWHWHLKFDHFLPVFTCRRLGLLYLWQYFLQHIALQRSRSSLERFSVEERGEV